MSRCWTIFDQQRRRELKVRQAWIVFANEACHFHIMAVQFKLTVDGFEAQWQTIYSAPLLLLKTLLPVSELPAATSSSEGRDRIMNVPSDAAFVRGPKALNSSHRNLEYVTGGMTGW